MTLQVIGLALVVGSISFGAGMAFREYISRKLLEEESIQWRKWQEAGDRWLDSLFRRSH